ncbi:GNAT family N-acetyltransferase [Thermodesulfobacteriota bacterium]
MVEIQNRYGRVFEVFCFKGEGEEKLSSFYDLFEPKGEYQGIPPIQKKARNRWISELINNWQNFLILDGESVVGHAAMALEGGPLQEIIVFLHQDYRGQGIGSEVLNYIRAWLEGKVCGRLWLSVQNSNILAIRCFLNVGFKFTSPPFESERDMTLDLEDSG